MTSAADLIEARRLRNAARDIVRTDIATVRVELAERSLGTRLRDQVMLSAAQATDEGIALANENRVVVGLTVAAAFGWLFRNPLGTLSRRTYFIARRVLTRWRA